MQLLMITKAAYQVLILICLVEQRRTINKLISAIKREKGSAIVLRLKRMFTFGEAICFPF